MKIYQKKNAILGLAILSTIIFVFVQTATAQQLKPKEIIYSRLQTNLQAAPTGANQPTIWAIGQDGANDRQITTGTQPRISDDGRYLLFKRFPGSPNNPYGNPWGGDGQLWVRELATGTETMIFSWYYAGYVLGYYFSPESNQGIYQIILSYITLTYKMNLDGTGGTPIPGQLERDFFPVVRRGDSKIVSHAQGENGLATLTFDTATRTVIPNTQTNDFNPSWSNDNQLVGYGTIFPANANPFNVAAPYPYVFGKLGKTKPDGTGRTQLLDLTGGSTSGGTNGITFSTIWTNDNSKIIVAAKINGVSGLYAAKTDGSGTYTRIPISNGNAPDWVGGIVQPRTDAQLISNGGGLITDQNGNFAAKEDGSIEADIAQVNQYSLVDSIGEPVAGGAMSGGGFSFTSGFVPNTPANIAGGTGSEGDVAGRPNGDGQVLANDVVEVQRFQIGLDQPFQSNEFQRADVAPFLGGGDGQILANDVIETQRYQIGLDQPQTALGPVDFGSSRQFEISENSERIAAPRSVHVENLSAIRGQTVTVNILVDALGDESAYGFNLNYSSAALTATSAQIGTAGGSRLCNLTVAGQIRCSINNFSDDLPGSDTDQIGEIHVGNNQLLLKVNFTVAANAPGGTSSLTLSNVNASNDAAQLLTISGQDGTLTVNAPTAAGVSIGGRVLTADGEGIQSAQVTVIAQNGASRGTLTNKWGRFRFDDLAAGETYIFRVAAKRFTFSQNSSVVAAGEATDDLVFVADGQSVTSK